MLYHTFLDYLRNPPPTASEVTRPAKMENEGISATVLWSQTRVARKNQGQP